MLTQAKGSTSEEFGIALCQMTSTDNIENNEKRVFRFLKSLAGDTAVDLICFPENVLYFRIGESRQREVIRLDSPIFSKLSDWCQVEKKSIHLGSIPLEIEGAVYATSVLIQSHGRLDYSYRKIHLFDVDVAGVKPIRESDSFKRGSKPHVFEINGWRFGSSICYDLRFAELYMEYAHEEVDVILVPAAFLVPTGKAHWHVLLRARAIESQAYVVAAAQVGQHSSEFGSETRQTYGHSLVVDPWGEVITDMGDSSSEEKSVVIRMRRDSIDKVRTQIPMKAHRRLRGFKSQGDQ